jgi:hypothetical protein
MARPFHDHLTHNLFIHKNARFGRGFLMEVSDLRQKGAPN